MVKRFALVGKSGSGKSEFSRFLASHGGVEIVKTGVICRRISNVLFGNDDKASTQKLDDVLTQIDPSIFLKAALRPLNENASYVIDSLRFRSDLEIALELGCQVVRLRAAGPLRVERLERRGQVFDIQSDGIHRTELELADITVDYEIDNVGSLEELEGLARKLLET